MDDAMPATQLTYGSLGSEVVWSSWSSWRTWASFVADGEAVLLALVD